MARKKNKAAELIAQAQERKLGFEEPPEAARAEVEAILKYNDSAPARRRVQQDKVLEMLREDYGWQHGRHAFNSWLRHRFGRKSWWNHG